MTPLAARSLFLALLISLALPLVGAGRARGDVVAQYALGANGELSNPAVLNAGRSGPGYEATDFDINVTASNISLSDSIPPSAEEYIEITSPSYVDANGNQFPVLRFQPGNNSRSPDEAVTKDKYFQFTVTANAGLSLNLTSLTFDCARGGGAMPRGWVLLSSVDGFANPIDTQEVLTQRPNLTNFTVDLSGASFQQLSAVTFRMYVYVPGGGQSLEYSNVTLNGKVQ
jgi:hypothetical protein